MAVRIPPKTRKDAEDTTKAVEEAGNIVPGDAVPDSVATTVEDLVADHNALLASLRAAGFIAE